MGVYATDAVHVADLLRKGSSRGDAAEVSCRDKAQDALIASEIHSLSLPPPPSQPAKHSTLLQSP